jgi:hypothetical protein
MKYIGQKQDQKLSLPPLVESIQPSLKESPRSNNMKSLFSTKSQKSMTAYDLDKQKFGHLLPKTGVYFLPDERIIVFLKCVNDMRKRYEQAGNYLMANKFKRLFDRWSEDEQER